MWLTQYDARLTHFDALHLTACPRHEVLLRQRCAGCAEPLRLAAGQAGCGRCGAAIGAMATHSIAEDPDGVELSGLLWRATGCLDGASPLEGLTLAVGHPLRLSGTPEVLRDLWGDGQALVAGDGGPRLQAREIAAVHEALVAAWRLRRDGPPRGQGRPFPSVRTHASCAKPTLMSRRSPHEVRRFCQPRCANPAEIATGPAPIRITSPLAASSQQHRGEGERGGAIVPL